MDQDAQFRQAIAYLEAQRSQLGDAVVDASTAALREKLAAPAMAARSDQERKRVTVLFADLAGWSQLAAALDPEDLHAIQRAFFTAITPPIIAHGGCVEKYIGDAVLAVFGAPQTHEDDAERAVLAALAMQQAVAEVQVAGGTSQDAIASSAHVQPATVQPATLQLRIGIHTGLVISQCDRASDVIVTGDPVNLAFRLQEAAPPGAIVVSEATQRLIAHAFALESIGSLALRGRGEATPAFRVLHSRTCAGKSRGVAGLHAPLVGRQAELDTLSGALAQLAAGQGGVAAVMGEAGIGKSRLVAELRKLAIDNCPLTTGNSRLRSVHWVEGRCLSYGGGMAYHLWLDLLRGVTGATLDQPPEAVAAALRRWVDRVCPEDQDATYPYLARLMALPLDPAEEQRLAGLAAPVLQQRTFEAVERIVACALALRPLALVCEDLHWGDPSSLALLERLLPLTQRGPLLLIALFRPEPGRDHPTWRLDQWAAQRQLALHLQPLSAGESEALLVHLLGQAVPARLAWRILAQAEGNPFYVEEIIRALIACGALARDPATGRYSLANDVDEIAIPDSLQSVLAARFDRLHHEERRVLQLASVLGRIFLHRVLAAIAGEVDDLDGRLRSLEQQELIRPRPGQPELEYAFKHALTQEAAYNGLLRRQRQQFHRQAAEALEQLYPQRQEDLLGLLAYHWEHSDQPQRAVDYLLRAGDRERLAYARPEANDYYQRSLALLQAQGDDEAAARVLLRLGLIHAEAFDYQQASQAYERGFTLWSRRSRTPDVEPPSRQPFRLMWGIEPKDWHPNPSFDYEIPLFSGLLEESADLQAVPDVACRWDLLDGGRTYIFHLRDDVRWSDGQPVTAEDFEFAWKRLLDPAAAPMNARRRALDPSTGLRSADLLHDVRGARAYHLGQAGDPSTVGVRAVDPLTLVVTLEQPATYFLHVMAHPVAFPVPRHCVARYGDDWCEAERIVGNGPFLLKQWHPRRRVDLARYPLYHGRFGGNVHEVELLCLPYPTEWRERLALYEQDQLDILYIGNWPVEGIETARRRHPNEMRCQAGMHTTATCFNTNRPPFDDVRVRQAFVHALDRQGLLAAIQGDSVDPATGGLVPPAMAGHSAHIGLPFDPARARQLLTEAGYPGGRGFPEVEMCAVMTPNTSLTMVRWAQALRETLNISLQWTAVDWLSYYQRLERRPPHVGMLIWSADYPDPDNFLRVAYRHSQRYFGWRNTEYERLIDGARQLADPAARLRLYRQADTILVREAAIVPYLHNPALHLVKPWVHHWPQSALGTLSMWTALRDTVIAPHEVEAIRERN